MQGNKHRWTYEEDKFCCQKFIEYYVKSRSDIDISSFVRLLQQDLPDIKSNSLRMKIQNIKQILCELGIENALALTPLRNYSVQNMKAMKAVLQEKAHK